jgi:hypothetical protein
MMALAAPMTDSHDGCYFERPPEKLVLEGYRNWTAGFETGSVAPWEIAWRLYADTLGDVGGRRALAELSYFIRTLGRCSHCPLRAFPFGARHVCRDECLTLGLIAACQHRDTDAADICLAALACPSRLADLAVAAADFAGTLLALEQRLLPIPSSAIEDILARAARKTVH